MNKPLVSIIVPVYNAECYIERCINQLIHQTFPQIEIIMIDDGSTDKSGLLCDDFVQKDSRCICIHKMNEGVSKARNDGLDRAKGAYICFVDGDDIVSIDYVERLYNALIRDKTDICICDFYEVKETDIDMIHFGNHSGNSTIIYTKEKYDSNKKYSHKTVWAALFSRNIIGECRFNEKFYVAEDSMFFYEVLLKNDRISYIEEPLYAYIIYEQSASHGKFDEKKFSEIKALNVIRDLYKNENRDTRNSIDVWYCTICAKQIRMMIKSNVEDISKMKYLKREGMNNFAKLMASNLSLKTKLLCFLSIFCSRVFRIMK